MRIHPIPIVRALAALLLGTSLCLVAGCGGDDDAPAVAVGPAATLNLGADSAVLDWNAPATVDVLANDSASSGSLSLVSAGGAAHGSVAVVGAKLVYSPAAGYFGADRFEYTARADASGATAKGTVSVSVAARLQVSGTASDAPLANATVTVNVGTATFTTVTDAAGLYRLDLRSANPEDMVMVSAAGSGTQSKVKLISLAGDVAALAVAINPDGEVTSNQVPALDATHLSTAQAVLMMRAGTPGTAAALAEARSRVNGVEMLRLATFVRLIADKGVALPAGASDTLALLQTPALLAAFTAEQMDAEYERFAAAQTEVVAQAPARARIDTLAQAADQTLAYVTTYANGGSTAVITYRTDGSAIVSAFGISAALASWTRSGAAVTLTLAAPFSNLGVSAQDPSTGEQYLVRDDITGLQIRHLSGDAHIGTAAVAIRGSQTYVDGPFAGQATSASADSYGMATRIDTVVDVSRRLPIDAPEVAAGVRLAGLIVGVGVNDGRDPWADILHFDSASAATLEMTQETVGWSLVDRWLVVTRPGGEVRRYARLFGDAGNGQETWLVRNDSGPDAGRSWVTSVVRADASEPFTTASAARRWVYADLAVEFPSPYPDFSLLADGSGEQGLGTSVVWTLDAQGWLRVQRFQADGSIRSDRRWSVLKRIGNNVQVFETLLFYNFVGDVPLEIRRVRWLADQGPASPP